MLAIARSMPRINLLAVKLGHKNMQYRVKHRLGRSFQEVRQADEYPAFTHSDGVVEVLKRKKSHLKIGHGGARSQLSIDLLEQGTDTWIRLRCLGHD